MSYCVECGEEVTPQDSFCGSCGEKLEQSFSEKDHSGSTSKQTTEAPKSNWWMAVAAPYGVLILVFSIGFIEGITPYKFVGITDIHLNFLVILGSVVSGIGLHHDRKYFMEHTDREPDVMYYLTVIPVMNYFIAGAYLLNRKRWVSD